MKDEIRSSKLPGWCKIPVLAPELQRVGLNANKCSQEIINRSMAVFCYSKESLV